ncbi:hypothetical protein EDB89DRAFT_1909653 [Lactarius sanguifluus]|nr:hypothetical protein EDB89DRAFT_1909653 [Lactarius sanguifluus]
MAAEVRRGCEEPTQKGTTKGAIRDLLSLAPALSVSGEWQEPIYVRFTVSDDSCGTTDNRTTTDQLSSVVQPVVVGWNRFQPPNGPTWPAAGSERWGGDLNTMSKEVTFKSAESPPPTVVVSSSRHVLRFVVVVVIVVVVVAIVVIVVVQCCLGLHPAAAVVKLETLDGLGAEIDAVVVAVRRCVAVNDWHSAVTVKSQFPKAHHASPRRSLKLHTLPTATRALPMQWPNHDNGPIHRFIPEPQNWTEPTGVGPTQLPESQKTGPHGLNRLIQAVASSTSRRGRRASGCQCVDVAAVVTVVAVVTRRSHHRRRRLVDVAAKVAAVEVSPSVSPFKLPKCCRRSVVVLVVAVVADVLWVQLWSVIVDAMLMIVVIGDGAVVVFEAVVEAVGVVGWSWLIVAVKTGWDRSQPALWRFTHLPDLDEPQPTTAATAATTTSRRRQPQCPGDSGVNGNGNSKKTDDNYDGNGDDCNCNGDDCNCNGDGDNHDGNDYDHDFGLQPVAVGRNRLEKAMQLQQPQLHLSVPGPNRNRKSGCLRLQSSWVPVFFQFGQLDLISLCVHLGHRPGRTIRVDIPALFE